MQVIKAFTSGKPGNRKLVWLPDLQLFSKSKSILNVYFHKFIWNPPIILELISPFDDLTPLARDESEASWGPRSQGDATRWAIEWRGCWRGTAGQIHTDLAFLEDVAF